MTEASDNRRIEPRAPISLKVEYKRLNSFFADYTRNISRGGTFIRTQNPLPIGTSFIFELRVPKLEDALRIQGKVQWTVSEQEAAAQDDTDAGMGIGFVYGSEAERERVERIVDTLMVNSLGGVIFEKLMKRAPR
ncbi:MAG: TIGR02266 family protein [Deltaproteobacteria bacterium]|nr:TIGR02266 family protein [Deltaproteobacteria bacterium]